MLALLAATLLVFRPMDDAQTPGDATYPIIYSPLAASRTSASLTFPVLSRICCNVASGENCGIGGDKCLFSVLPCF